MQTSSRCRPVYAIGRFGTDRLEPRKLVCTPCQVATLGPGRASEPRGVPQATPQALPLEADFANPQATPIPQALQLKPYAMPSGYFWNPNFGPLDRFVLNFRRSLGQV